jgi:hypothetical protein
VTWRNQQLPLISFDAVSTTNQVSGRTTDFMEGPDKKGDAVAEQEPGHAWGL